MAKFRNARLDQRALACVTSDALSSVKKRIKRHDSGLVGPVEKITDASALFSSKIFLPKVSDPVILNLVVNALNIDKNNK